MFELEIAHYQTLKQPHHFCLAILQSNSKHNQFLTFYISKKFWTRIVPMVLPARFGDKFEDGRYKVLQKLQLGRLFDCQASAASAISEGSIPSSDFFFLNKPARDIKWLAMETCKGQEQYILARSIDA